MLAVPQFQNLVGELTARLESNPDWPRFLSAMVLVMVRISGLMIFAPIFSSAAIPPRVKVARSGPMLAL